MPKMPARQNLKPQKICMFCKIPRKMSGEHLFPKWFGKLIEATHQRHNYFRTNITNGQVSLRNFVKLEGDLSSRKMRVVCKVCNEGWMSKIEDAAGPIMTKLILGKPHHLTQADQHIIAVWITLKTIIGETDDPENAAIPSHQIDEFYLNKEPLKNCAIWIGQYEGSTWSDGKRYTHVGAHAGYAHLPKFVNPSTKNTQTTTIFMGKLCIHAFSTTLANITIKYTGPKARCLMQIWPAERFSIDWPLKRTITDEMAARIAYGLIAQTRPG